jgi:hypothetical protein
MHYLPNFGITYPWVPIHFEYIPHHYMMHLITLPIIAAVAAPAVLIISWVINGPPRGRPGGEIGYFIGPPILGAMAFGGTLLCVLIWRGILASL